MGFFDGIETAKSARDSNYMRPGQYDLEVLETKTGTSPRDATPYCCAEFKVLAAAPGSAHAPGDTVSHLIPKKGLYWQGDVKAMVAAVMGIKPEQVDGAGCDMFFGTKQPAKGRKVRARAFNKQTKALSDFTVVRYSAVQA